MRIIVTRHPALVEYLHEQGISAEFVLLHASAENVSHQDVVGVLPMNLACLCQRFREVSMHIPAWLRGKELTLEQIKNCRPKITEYKITKIREWRNK